MDGIESTDREPRTRRGLRLERQQRRRLAMRHRWFAGITATVLSAAMVVVGVPALAATGDGGSGDDGTSSSVDTTTGGDTSGDAQKSDATTTDDTSTDDTTTDDTSADDATKTDTTETDGTEKKGDGTQSKLEDEPVVSLMLIDPCTGGSCSTITRSVTMSGGGPASASDWEYRATNGADWYVIPNTGGIDVIRQAYVISAVSLNANTQNYTTTVTCSDPGSGVSWNSGTSTLTFSGGTARTSNCTFTQTYNAPASTAITVNARVTASPVGVNGSTGTNYANTNGATFRLYTNNGGVPGTALADAWATCTIASGGACTITVPDTQAGGANNGKQFFVVQTAAGAGAYTVDLGGSAYLKLGDALGPTQTWYYPNLTPALQPNAAVSVPQLSGAVGDTNGSFGAVANALNNPDVQAQCTGISVAIVMDLSSSVNGDQRTAFRNAIVGSGGLFDSLMDKASIAVFNFGTDSPASGNSNYPTPMALTSANRATLESRVNTSSSGTQYTNWDKALRVVADATATNKYDIVLFVTDGAPNYIRSSGGVVGPNGTTVTVRSIEAAVYSANAIKAAGTKVIGVGVGNGVSGDVIRNLRFVSGPTVNDDYFQTASWAALNQELVNIASSVTCQVPIKITKQVLNSQGQNPTADNGWTVSATPSAVSTGTTTLAPVSTTQVTAGSGANTGQANWTLRFSAADATATVTIGENASSKPNYTFVGGSCTIFHKGGTSDTVTLTTNPQALTGIKASDRIDCVIQNRPNMATLKLVKNVDNKGVGTRGATEWTLTANGAAGWVGTTTGTAATASTAAQAVPANTTLTLGETGPAGYTGGSWTCDSGVTVGAGGTISLSSGANVTCQITNTVNTVTVTLVKRWLNGISGDTAALAIGATTKTSTANGTADFTDTANQITVTTVPGATLTLSEVLGAGNAGTYGSALTCTAGTYPANGQGGYTLTVPGSNTTCTFANTANTATVSLTKAWVNSITGDKADLFIKTPAGTTLATSTATAPTGQTTTATVRVGDSVVLSELLGAGNQGSYGQTWSCTGATAPANNALTTGTIVVPAGGLSCTVTNTAKTVTVSLTKAWGNAIAGDTANLFIKTPSGTELGTNVATAPTGQTVSVPVRVGDSVVLSEVLGGGNLGAYGQTWSCTGATAPANDALTTGTVVVPAGGISCTVTNTAKTVTVSLTKAWSNAIAGDKADLFVKTAAGAQLATKTSTAPTGETVTAAVRIGDSIVLSEALGLGNLGAYGQTWSCTGATAPANNALATGTIVVPAGGVSCTVTNTAKTATVTVNKQWVSSLAGDTASITVNGGAPGVSTTAGGSQTDLSVVIATVRIGDPVSISEALGTPSGGHYTSTWSCTGAGGSGSGTSISIPSMPNGNVVCTFVNTGLAPQLTVDKSDGTAQQLADGSWQIDYTITVANGSAFASRYTLTDLPQLGAGWTVSGTSWRDPANPANPASAPAADTPIAASPATHTYVYRIIATRDAAVSQPSLVCSPGNGGAFFNTATIVFPGGTDSDSGCAQPASPTVVKTAQASTQNPDGTWTLSYQVVVSNTSGMQLSYELTDVPQALPTGVTPGDALGWQASGPAVAGGGTGALTAGWTGEAPSTQLATGLFPSGATHTYTVTRVVSVAADVADDEINDCGATPNDGGGLWNTATVTNRAGGNSSSDCAEIDRPEVDVEKTVTSTVQNADGTWTITYDVVVTNLSSQYVAVYDLTDDLLFGGDITVDSASWTGPGGTSGTFSGTSATLATDRVLAKSGVETYTVTANATIDVDAWEEGTVACDASPNPDNGGFLNTATVTAAGESTTAHDCSEPKLPTVDKTAVSAVQDGTDPDTWLVTYTLTVHPSGFASYYTLKDIPGFSTGVTLGAGTAQRTGTPDVLPITSGGTFPATAVALGAAETHTWTVTWAVTITGEPPVATPLCTGAPGGGLYNAVELLQDGTVIDDGEACIPVKTSVYPTPTKTVTSTVQNADGTWTITYDVTVSLPGVGPSNPDGLSAKYNLSDTLKFGAGITVTSATWSGQSSGTFSGTTAQLAMAKTIAAGATHTYTVTANATVPVSAYPSATVCNPDGTTAGGFLNTATLTATGTTPVTVDDCSQPKLPTVEKTAVGVTQTANPQQWLVSYDITVSPSGYATTYQLEDTPGFASGVTIVGTGTAQRTSPPGAPVTITPGAVFPATTVALGAAETHVWRVVWLVSIDGSTPVTAPECGQTPVSGKGFYNLVELTNNGTVIDDGEACDDIPEPVGPEVGKTVTSTTQNADGTWTIVYSVTATQPAAGPGNPDGFAGQYDLDDELEFGGDIDIVSASWTGPGGASDGFTDGAATLATGRAILPGVTDTYTVTVVADVTADAIGETTSCEPGENPDAGGFLNTVELTSLGGDDEAHACSEPVFPLIQKTGGTTVDNGDGTFDLSYTIVVSYPATTRTPKPTASYTLTDAPTLPTGVSLVGNWAAAAVGAGTPAPTGATWNGSGTWTIVGPTALTPTANGDGTHTYTVTATVEVTAAPAGPPWECADTHDSGILVLNVGTVTSGDYETSDDGCQIVHWDDVTIVKTSKLPGEQTSVAPGDTFDYVLTVTNQGTRAAQDVVVTDEIPSRLAIVSVTPPAGWTDVSPGGNTVVVSTPSLAVGASVDIVVKVTFLPVDVPVVTEGEVPPAATPLEELANEACVEADVDLDPTNDCDDVDIPTRDVTAVVYTYCEADAAYLGWEVKKSSLLEGSDIDLAWSADDRTTTTDPYEVDLTHPGGDADWSDELLWPGVMLTPSGVSIDYPGWRPLKATDYAPGGGYYIPGTTTVMTPTQQGQMIFNGLILDPSELDFAWRGATTLTFTVNPTLTVAVDYPETNADCAVARHSDVQIEKTASVDKAYPGTPFTYTLEVANVSDDSAADDVVVTDPIPAEIKVTDITWPGKGDPTVFPNWESCTVTGQDGAGYGGTLECVLFGPLEPLGAFESAPSSAPTITLSVVSNPATTVNKVTNVAGVAYCTFDDHEDCGYDEDDAVVYLWKLPFTGQELALGSLAVGLIALLGGAALIITRRRRREQD